MSPDAARLFLRAGIFVMVAALFLVLLVPRDSAEFVVSVCSLAIGMALTGLVLLVNQLTK